MDRTTYWANFYKKHGIKEPGPLQAGNYVSDYIEGGLHWYNIIYDLVEVQNANIMDPKRPGTKCLWSGAASSGPSEACGYPQFLSVDSAVNAFIDFGVPAEKLIMGAAHYGRAFHNVEQTHPNGGDHNSAGYNSVFGSMCAWDYYDCFRDSNGVPLDPKPETGMAYCMTWDENEKMAPLACDVEGFMKKWNVTEEPRFVAYKDVVRILETSDDFEYHFDNAALAPFLWNEADKIFITYEDERSIRHKSEYVNQRNMGGLMYWQMGQDTADLKLTRTMDDTLLAEKVRLGYWLVDPNDAVDDGRNVPPENIPWNLLNRVHLSFFNIEGDDSKQGEAPFHVKVPRAIRNNQGKYVQWADYVMRMFRERDAKNPGCEIAIAIGGWALGNRNAPDAYAYSAGIASSGSRATLIDSAIDIMTMEFLARDFPQYADEIRSMGYEFNVFDMDWEYPGQQVNGKIWDAVKGAPVDCFSTPQGMLGDVSGCVWTDTVNRADVQNLAAFFREFKARTNGRYKRTIASAGAIYSMSFILQDLDLLAAELENINVMTYDFSGPWLQRPSADLANGYGNINCRFDTGKWNWWLCSGGYLTGPATAHHTNLYPSVKGMNALACNDPSAPNTPGCWNGVREQSYSMYGGWKTSMWSTDPCQLDAYGQTFWQSEQQCRDSLKTLTVV
jgi:GH18 family chitinase